MIIKAVIIMKIVIVIRPLHLCQIALSKTWNVVMHQEGNLNIYGYSNGSISGRSLHTSH